MQAVIMAMILTNVPVFLRQGLALDWLALTASFVVIVIPVILRPLFAWMTDRRPALLPSMLALGIVLVVAGSAGASVGAGMGSNGLILLTLGFAVAVVGATLMNVAADSHVVRAVPLDQSARVNSRKRLSAFLGVVLGQGCYIFMVGTHFADFGRWMTYFAVPAVVSVVSWMVFAIKHGWRVLSSVEGLPPVRAPWLAKAQADAMETGRGIPRHIVLLLLIIAFLFMIPGGLIETTFENFIVDTYGSSAWLMYSSIMIGGVLLEAVGYVLAGRSSKRAPEWDVLWYVPVIAAFDLLLWTTPSFAVILVAVMVIQAPAAFILVRLLQSWQGHSYSRRPALTFQVFMATYQIGKLIGIGFSGFIMISSGYAGIFAGAVIVWVVVMGFAVTYHLISKK